VIAGSIVGISPRLMPGLFFAERTNAASEATAVSFAHALSSYVGIAVGVGAALPFPRPLLQFAGTDEMQ
jgi:hypothetical protein